MNMITFNEWQDYIQGGITDVYCLPIFNKKQYIGDVVFASREKKDNYLIMKKQC